MNKDELALRTGVKPRSLPDVGKKQPAKAEAPVKDVGVTQQRGATNVEGDQRGSTVRAKQGDATEGPQGPVKAENMRRIAAPDVAALRKVGEVEAGPDLGKGIDKIAPGTEWGKIRLDDVSRTHKGEMFAVLEDPSGKKIRVSLDRGTLKAAFEPRQGRAIPINLEPLAAADLRMVLASAPRPKLDGAQQSILGLLEGLVAERAGDAPHVWPTPGRQVYEVFNGGPGAFAEEPENKLGIVDRFKQYFDRPVSKRLKKKILADDRVQIHEVWLLVNDVRDLGRITPVELKSLKDFRNENARKFDPPALAAMDRLLALADPDARPKPTPPKELRALWDESRKWPWNPDATIKPKVAPDEKEALAASLKIFAATNENGYEMATANAAFFDMYPSVAGRQFVAFMAGWAINETFDTHPLQAFDYSRSLPFGADGKPKHALWQAYVEAVESGSPAAIVEEAYLRAHIYDYKRIVHDPDFKAMYALAPASYHKAIDAYLESLARVEKELLDAGRDPVAVSKYFIVGVAGDLVKRGTIGMVWHGPSFRNGMDNTNPHTNIWWNGAWGMAAHVFLGMSPKYNAPTEVVCELSAAEAQELAAATGLPLKAGRNEISKEQFEGATFAEPERRIDPKSPARRWPLTFDDFVAAQKLRKGLTPAGIDGVFQAEEMRGVLRNVQARVRSQLIQDFHAQYPVPIGGLLVYSANMLAMNQAYAEHTLYGMIPNYIMPVDNDGKPKGPLWEKYVAAYEEHKKKGTPSEQSLQRLWFEAHMEDFKALDSPEAQQQLVDFWNQAILDPTLAPLAIYALAMVHGRDVFERARQNELGIDAALQQSFMHVVNSIVEAKSFPFWKQDMQELGRWLFSPRYHKMPDVDDRGLPTDKALVSRSLQGLRDLTGLATLLVGPKVPLLRNRSTLGEHPRADKLLSLRDALPAEDLAKLDPRIVQFYEDPRAFQVRMHADFGLAAANEDKVFPLKNPGGKPPAGVSPDEVAEAQNPPWWKLQGLRNFATGVWGAAGRTMSHAAFRTLGAVTGIGNIPEGVAGKSYEVEMDVAKDDQDRAVWLRRFVSDDGVAFPIFDARFEVRDGRVVETFNAGRDIELVFEAKRDGAGLRLSLLPNESSALARFSNIEFVTQPDATTGGLRTVGGFTGKGVASFIKGMVTFSIESRTA